MTYRLKQAREARNMTQQELSERSCVSRTTINGLESGRVTSTSTKVLMKLAEALETTVTDLFFDETV